MKVKVKELDTDQGFRSDEILYIARFKLKDGILAEKFLDPDVRKSFFNETEVEKIQTVNVD